MMRKMYQALKPGAVLTTYSAKGAFKRLLKDIGFEVQALPGPKGKREMTRAIKPA
jgi:tRNA U34 5-methylaminomethyl-2-thiouridine-forming methyltransferase MnmC